MALSLGKLSMIVGAGLVGSVLAKEGRVPGVSDLVSGAYKIFFKQLQKDESTATSSKPKYDSLMQQVKSLQDELSLFATNRSITIVTQSRSGSGKYGIIVIVLTVGYGYVWWKGWRISDMMFATKGGLNDACSSVAKQLDKVFSSVAATRKHLSSRIDRVDCKIDECGENTAATRDEVSELRGDVKKIGSDFQSVHHVVRSLETKISRIEVRQNTTNFGVVELVKFVRGLETTRPMEPIEGAASRPALELPKVSPSRTASLPPISSIEPPTPTTSNGSHRKQASFSPSSSSQSKASASGLKELHGLSDALGLSSLSPPKVSNETQSSVVGRTFSPYGFLSRSRSAVQSTK